MTRKWRSSDEQTRTVIGAVVTDSKKTALKSVATLPLVMLVAYLLLMLYFRKLGRLSGCCAVGVDAGLIARTRSMNSSGSSWRLSLWVSGHLFPLAYWLAAGSVSMSAGAQSSSEWRALFNGKDLEGWRHVGPGQFVIENGVLKTEGGMGLLWYAREKFGDATIRVVFRAPQPQGAGNSGVFIRIPTEPTEPWMPVHKGYEVQIDENDSDFHRTGVLYSFTKAQAKPETARVEHDGDHAGRRSHRRRRERRDGHRLPRGRSRSRAKETLMSPSAAAARTRATSVCRTTTRRTSCCSARSA